MRKKRRPEEETVHRLADAKLTTSPTEKKAPHVVKAKRERGIWDMG